MAIINLDVFCSFRFIEFENGSYYMLVFEPNVAILILNKIMY